MATKLNYRLLLILIAVAGLAIPCAMIQHDRQSARLSQQLRERAQQEIDDGRPDRAAPILERYLTLNSGDMDRLADYALLLGRLPDAERHQGRQLSALEKVLEHNPAQTTCRRRLAELLYEMGDPESALQQTQQLLNRQPGDAEILTLEGRCHDALGQTDLAVQAYEEAIQKAPMREEAYVCLANQSFLLGRTQRALRVLDDFVGANPNRPEAYLRRARMQLRLGHLTETDEDLKRYLQKLGNRQSPDFLQTQGDLASRRGDPTMARRDWELALGFRPGNVDLTIGLARLELAAGHVAEALEWINRGLSANPGYPGLVQLQVEALAISGQWEIAQRAIAALRAADGPHGLASFLDARLLMARGKWSEAAALLEDVSHVEGLPNNLEPRIYLNLGICREKLGQRDAEGRAYQKAAELDGSLTVARLGYARAALRKALAGSSSGDKDAEAIIRSAAQQPNAAAGAALLLADLRLARGRRAEAQAAFGEIRKTSGYSELADLWLAEARWQAAAGDPAEAARVLMRAGAVPQLRNRLDLRLGSLEVATWLPYDDAATLVRSLVPEPASLPRFIGQALGSAAALRPALVGPYLLTVSDQLQTGNDTQLSSLPAGDQARLLRQEALALARLGSRDEADRIRRRMANVASSDLPSAIYLLDVAMEDGDEFAVAAALERFKQLGDMGKDWVRVGWAARLLMRSGDQSTLNTAREMLDPPPAEPAAAARAEWLQAVLEDRTGHPDAALAGYLEVAQRGEIRLPLLTRLVTLLRDRQRYAEADRLFEQAEGNIVLRDGLVRLAADCALRAGRSDRAALLARRGVSAAMGVDGQVWLGQFLARAGQSDAATTVLREAAAKSTTMDPWLALIGQLVSTGKLKEAVAERARLAGVVRPEDQALALASADEILGHWTAAAAEYEQATKAAPKSLTARERAARFYLRAAQPQAALPHLIALFPPVPYGEKDDGRLVRAVTRLVAGPTIVLPDALLPWARRQLALTLVDVAPQANRAQALNLLRPEAGDSSTKETALTSRARAFVQATDPAERSAMRTLLESQAGAMSPEERFRLAQLVEADGDSAHALEHARAAWEGDKSNPEYLVWLIRHLVKMNQRPEAQRLLALLAEKEGESDRCRELRMAIEMP